MITYSFSIDDMDICIDGQESVGPYGYLCLGLIYDRDGDNESLYKLSKLILVEMDVALRKCIELPLYVDQFEYPIKDIVKRDGVYYYKDTPVLNYDILNIPQKIMEYIGEIDKESGLRTRVKKFIDLTGETKYYVNRICARLPYPENQYREVYASVVDFDEETLSGHFVGFDMLGKILVDQFNLSGVPVSEIRSTLMSDMVLYNRRYNKRICERLDDCGFLNFDYAVDRDKVCYRYFPVF